MYVMCAYAFEHVRALEEFLEVLSHEARETVRVWMGAVELLDDRRRIVKRL